MQAQPRNQGDFRAARITVRPSAVVANFKTLQRLAGPAVAAAVVKADAYGLGIRGLAPALLAAGCDSFFVARLEEGIALRALAPKARIFVLDGAPPDAVPALIDHHLIPVLGSLDELAGWQAAARASRQKLEAVIHVDTGMNRLGLPGDELAVLAADAQQRLAGLSLVLVMSHLACSEETGASFNATQLARFKAALAMLPPAPASLAASGGVMLGPQYHFDLVRPGIALYGGNPRNSGPNLQEMAVTLTGRVLQLRRIDKGESVGYGAAFRAKRPSMIATVALGYADGILRAAAEKGVAVVNGKRAPFAGRVSMDLLTLDVTDLEHVGVGDEAEILGPSISLEDAAAAWGTNAYEVLTGLSRRIVRVYEGPSS